MAGMDGMNVLNAIWKGNQVVTLVLSFADELTNPQVICYDKATKKYISTGRPNIVKEYNRRRRFDVR